MKSTLYKRIFTYQDRHWFFVAKQYFFDALLQGVVKKNGTMKVADVGCGTGTLFPYLSRFGSIVGLDVSSLALSYASKVACKKDVWLVQTKGDKLSLMDSAFDIVCLSDVIQHKTVVSDTVVLDECFRILRPGGILMLTAPAFKILKRELDNEGHSVRRYLVPDIRRKLKKGGFSIKRVSYTYATLFPVILIMGILKKALPKRQGYSQADFNSLPYFLDRIMRAIFFYEAQLLRFVNFPFGSSVVAVATKTKR